MPVARMNKSIVYPHQSEGPRQMSPKTVFDSQASCFQSVSASSCVPSSRLQETIATMYRSRDSQLHRSGQVGQHRLQLLVFFFGFFFNFFFNLNEQQQ